VRRTPPWAVSPRVKSHNYLNVVMAELEVKQAQPAAWALLLDERGNLAEGANSNIFLVRGQKLLTPREQFVLPGITRSTVMGLAKDLGLGVAETDLDLRDAYLADEAFLTSTSLCVCGVASINGRPLRNGAFGPVTTELSKAFGRLVGMDVRGQYLAYLDDAGSGAR
jgi:branched-chain amino acid aminotransferase